MGLLLGRGDPCDLVVIDQSCPADARKAADDKLVSGAGRRNNRRRHAAPPDGAASRKRRRTARLILYDDYRKRLNGRPAIKAVAATWPRPKQPNGTTAALTGCTVPAYRKFESISLQERVERTAIACLQPIARPKVADAGEDRVGRWIDRGSIWRTSTPRSGRMPRRLTSSMSRCSATATTRTGTAAELAGKPEYLCPALIHRPNHSAVQPFRLIGTRAGLRPKTPKLVFDTTFLNVRRCRI